MKNFSNIKNKENEKWTRRIFNAVLFFWTVLLCSLAVWNYSQQVAAINNIALTVARDSYSKDVLFREWATMHGGVYVPVTQSTEPNKYLTQVKERDISTPSGKKLTLMNPAYMTRQIYELAEKRNGTKGHITSLNPIRPENAPDDWEKLSLQSFEKGEKEMVTVAEMGGVEYFRLMRPLVVAEGCLRCHSQQGYKTGEIRGGISVSIPWHPFSKAKKSHLAALAVGYTGVWFLAFAGLLFIRNLILKYLLQRKQAEEQISSLLAEKELLLKEVHHRIKNNMNTIKGLLFLQADSLSDPSAIAALQDAEGRVESMMVLYDKLYLSDNYRELSIKKYLPVLVEEIIRNFPNRESVRVEESIDNFIIEAETLFPLGIMVNEIITNMMKYAFAGRENGIIKISATLNKSHVTIEIQDNGIGLPESVDLQKSTGFGMQLVGMLTEQIGGNMRIERGDGARFVLEFDV